MLLHEIFVSLVILDFSQTLINVPTESSLEPHFKEYIKKYQSGKNISFCGYVNVNMNNTKDVSNIFIRSNVCPGVVAGKFFNASGYVARMHATFIFIDDFKKINETIKQLRNIPFWDPRKENHFIISQRLTNLDFLWDFMRTVWKRHIVNFVVVLVFKQLQIFSYNGFKKDEVVNLTKQQNLFQDKLSNLYDFQLRVSLFNNFPINMKENGKWVGPDIVRLKLVTSMINATYKIIEPPEHTFFTGAYEDAMHDVTDFCFISHYYMNNLYQDAEYTYPHETNQLSVVIPIQDEKFGFGVLLNTFNLCIWILFFTTIVTISLVTNLAKLPKNQTFLVIFLKCINSFLGNTFTNFKNQEFGIKIQLIIFFFSCIIFRTAFQSSLVSSFVRSKSHTQIDTISELRESKLKILSSISLANIVPEEYGLCDKISIISPPERLKRLYNLDTKTAYITVTTFANIFIETLKSQYAKPPFYVMKEKLVPSINTYILQRHTPYMEKLSQCLLRQVQYGLSKKNKYQGKHIKGNLTESDSQIVLGIQHLQSVFHLYLFGLLFSVLVFVIEVVYSLKNRILLLCRCIKRFLLK